MSDKERTDRLAQEFDELFAMLDKEGVSDRDLAQLLLGQAVHHYERAVGRQAAGLILKGVGEHVAAEELRGPGITLQ